MQGRQPTDTHSLTVSPMAGMTICLAAVSSTSYASHFNNIPQHTSKLTGQQWVDMLWNGHPQRFHNQLGIHIYVMHDNLRSQFFLAGVVTCEIVT